MDQQHTKQTRVYVSSTMDFKSRLHYWWMALGVKSALQHSGLLVTLMGYTVIGGMIFRILEHPAEVERLTTLNSTLKASRHHMVERIVNNTRISNLDALVLFELKEYEKTLQDAYKGGLSSPYEALQDLERWTILRAVFFSSTVITTIGYGHQVPVTMAGRVFCIAYALIGIPLTLTVIADWGRLFASCVSTLMNHATLVPGWCRHATVARRTTSYVFAAIGFLCVYLGIGAGLFMIWEDDWSFFDGFYFCFITMTTIGFGDIVPKKPKYMLICTLYILIGLALTSTIIELVRRQYLESWRQIQVISGPLAETLRRMTESAQGVDVVALQNNLRRAFAVVHMPKKSRKLGAKGSLKDEQQEWEEAVEAVIRDITAGAKSKPSTTPAVVQIVIYESSV